MRRKSKSAMEFRTHFVAERPMLGYNIHKRERDNAVSPKDNKKRERKMKNGKHGKNRIPQTHTLRIPGSDDGGCDGRNDTNNRAREGRGGKCEEGNSSDAEAPPSGTEKQPCVKAVL